VQGIAQVRVEFAQMEDSCQLSVVSCQLSVVSVSCQLSVVIVSCSVRLAVSDRLIGCQ